MNVLTELAWRQSKIAQIRQRQQECQGDNQENTGFPDHLRAACSSILTVQSLSLSSY